MRDLTQPPRRPTFRLAGAARRQVAAILRDSERDFGGAARMRYEALLAQAAMDLAASPGRPGTRAVSSLIIYHLSHSRSRVPDPPGRVGRPRHLLIARPAPDGVLDGLGVVHERMLLGRALRMILREVDAMDNQ